MVERNRLIVVRTMPVFFSVNLGGT